MQTLSKNKLPNLPSGDSPSSLKLKDLENSHQQLKSLETKLKGASTIEEVHNTVEAINQSLVAFSYKTNSFIADCLAPA